MTLRKLTQSYHYLTLTHLGLAGKKIGTMRKCEVLFLMRILGFFATNRVFLHKIQLQNHNIALQRAIKIKFLLKNHRKKIVFDENFQN